MRRKYIRRTPSREEIEMKLLEEKYARFCHEERKTISQKTRSEMKSFFEKTLKKLRDQRSPLVLFFRSCKYLVEQLEESFWIESHMGLARHFGDNSLRELQELLREALTLPKLLPPRFKKPLKVFSDSLEVVKTQFNHLPEFKDWHKEHIQTAT